MIRIIITTFFATLFLLSSEATFALANDPESSLYVCASPTTYCVTLDVTIVNNTKETFYLIENYPISTYGSPCGTLGTTSVPAGGTMKWSFDQDDTHGVNTLLILANKEHSNIIAIVAKQNLCMSEAGDVNTWVNSTWEGISVTNTKGAFGPVHPPKTPATGSAGKSVITIEY